MRSLVDLFSRASFYKSFIHNFHRQLTLAASATTLNKWRFITTVGMTEKGGCFELILVANILANCNLHYGPKILFFGTAFCTFFVKLYYGHGQPKSSRGPKFLKILILGAKFWTFCKDLIDFPNK
jgi:hypothetical protein